MCLVFLCASLFSIHFGLAVLFALQGLHIEGIVLSEIPACVLTVASRERGLQGMRDHARGLEISPLLSLSVCLFLRVRARPTCFARLSSQMSFLWC